MTDNHDTADQAPLPFFCIPVADWVLDTQLLRPTEYAALHRGLCLAWRTGRPLPTDPELLARAVGLTPAELTKAWPQIESFFQRTEAGWTSNLIERERSRALQQRKARQKGGHAAQQKRNSAAADGAAAQPAEQVAQPSTQHQQDGQPYPIPAYPILESSSHTRILDSRSDARADSRAPKKGAAGNGSQSDQEAIDHRIRTLIGAGQEAGEIIRNLKQFQVTAADVGRVRSAMQAAS